MNVTVMGVQKLDFVNGNGERIRGLNLYVAFPDENVDGLKTNKFFINDGLVLPKDMKLNDQVTVQFNYKGKIEAIYKMS